MPAECNTDLFGFARVKIAQLRLHSIGVLRRRMPERFY